tara:strand:+ start:3728 stop:3925 length:198 start_codon:yes stop_codon:yes gene_type:complete
MKLGDLAICIDSFNGIKKGTIGMVIDRTFLPAPPLKIKREIILFYVNGIAIRVPGNYIKYLDSNV